MKLSIVNHKEPGWKPRLLRCLMGPAYILEGLVQTLTLGHVVVGFPTEVARRTAKARFECWKVQP